MQTDSQVTARPIFRRCVILGIGTSLFLGTSPAEALQQPTEAALSGSDLIRIAAPVRSFRPKDEFDPSPSLDLSGRRFAIDLPVQKGGAKGCVSLPFWHYHPDHAELDVTFFGARRTGSFLKGYNGKVHPVLSDAGSFQTAPVRCIEASRGAYHASNAFGARTTIFRQSQSVVEIAATRPLGSMPSTDFLMASVKMAPADARQVTQTLRLRYEGRLTTWNNGSSVACGIEHLDPDMTTVDDTTVDTCIFRGVIESISVIDGQTGRVLAEQAFQNTDVAQRWPQ